MTVSPLAITATDLELWADRRAAQDQLPRLVRDLIFASGPRPQSITMVSGEGVQRGGWDGIVRSEGAPPFVPDGTSGWEMSVRKDMARKAKEDYDKRVVDPLGLAPDETTVVFVTAREWDEKQKEAWCEERRADRVWRDVRIIDGNDLEAWLSIAPAIHLRVAHDLGKRPPGVADLLTEWIDFEASTNPAFSPALVLAGRTEGAEEIRRRILSNQDVIPVAADSREEALAFFTASLGDLPETERPRILSRAIVIRDPSHWGALTVREEPLVLIPMFDDRRITSGAIRSGHRVVLPLGRDEGRASKTAVQIGRPRREALRAELEALGVQRYEARELAKVGRRSMLSLRRRIAKARDAEQPEWARPENAGDLVPAVLAGSWVDSFAKDREALERLSRRDYVDVSRAVRRWESVSDPPLRLVDNVWLLASKEDALPLISPAIALDDLEALRDVCVGVFEWVDPKHDMALDEQHLSSLYKEEPETSAALRAGLADTLALLGARDDRIAGGSGRGWVQRIVREALAQADEDWRRWATLSDVLPLLAEAAPEPFLDAVERDVRRDDPILAKLFRDQTSSMFASSPHVGLLWALERLAGSPEHMPRAALALARLERVDPGGKTLNRPLASLQSIFRLQHPATAAAPEIVTGVLETVLEREPEIGWKLLTHLVPERGRSYDLTSRPERRDWAPEDVERSIPQVLDALEAVVDLLLTHVGNVDGHWAELAGLLPRLPKSSFDRAVTALAELESSDLEPPAHDALLNVLRSLVAKHRKFPDAKWAMPAAQVDRLKALYDRLEPQDLIERSRWLFGERPALMDVQERDYRVREEALRKRRLQVVSAVHESTGLEGLLSLARGTTRPFSLGIALGGEDILSPTEIHELLDSGLGADDEIAQVAHGFTRAAAQRLGADWVGDMLRSEEAQNWTDKQKAEFMLEPWYRREVWELVDEAGGEVPRLYWSQAQFYGIRDYETAAEAAEKLLEHGRPYSAFVLLAGTLDEEEDPPTWDLIVRALEAAPRTDPHEDPADLLQYHLEDVLNRITNSGAVPEEKVAGLEWVWLPLIEDTGRSAEVLHRHLARSAEFFLEVAGILYSEPDEEDEISDGEAARIARARTLLRSWRVVPGTQDGGSLDAAALDEWVSKVLKAAGESLSRLAAEYEIGQMIAWSPRGHDGLWPHEAVRAVIERLESDILEQSIREARFNNGGVTMRAMFEGGDQERSAAERIEADASAMAARSVRTARMLRELARTYRESAQHHDASAELREDFMD